MLWWIVGSVFHPASLLEHFILRTEALFTQFDTTYPAYKKDNMFWNTQRAYLKKHLRNVFIWIINSVIKVTFHSVLSCFLYLSVHFTDCISWQFFGCTMLTYSYRLQSKQALKSNICHMINSVQEKKGEEKRSNKIRIGTEGNKNGRWNKRDKGDWKKVWNIKWNDDCLVAIE